MAVAYLMHYIRLRWRPLTLELLIPGMFGAVVAAGRVRLGGSEGRTLRLWLLDLKVVAIC